MATSWKEVTQKPEYQQLGPEDQERARNQYFQTVIIPQVSNQDDLPEVRRQFDASTSPTATPFGQSVQREASQMSAEDAQSPSLASQFGRAALRTGKALSEGAAGTVDLLAAPIRAGINAIAPQGYQAGTLSDLSNQSYDTIANYAGLNLSAQNAPERLSDAISRGVGSTIGGIGVGNALARSASPIVSGIGQMLASNPGAQAASATTSSLGSQLAQEGGLGQTGQTVAGLASGIVPSLASTLAGSAARNITSSVASPNAERQALALAAMDRGIPLKATQVGGGEFGKWVDSTTGMIPFSGSKGFEEAQRSAFDQAVGRTIGANPAAPRLTDQVFSKARDDTRDIYNNLWDRNNLSVSQDLRNEFSQALQDAISAKPEVLNRIQGYWTRITRGARLDDNGNVTLPGRSFKAIDADMSRDSISNDPEVRYYIGQVQDGLRNIMGQGMTQEDQNLLQQANRQWGNIKTLAPLVAKNPLGGISPTGLQSAVTNNASSKMAMATGNRGELGTLATIGQQFLKEPPQSGTEPRTLVRNLLGRIGSIGGALAGGNILGPLGTLGSAASILGGSRAFQSANQNPVLARQLAGQSINQQNIARQLGGLDQVGPNYYQLLSNTVIPSALATEGNISGYRRSSN